MAGETCLAYDGFYKNVQEQILVKLGILSLLELFLLMSKLVRENKQGFLGNELKTGFKALVLTKLKIQTTPKRLNPEELNNQPVPKSPKYNLTELPFLSMSTCPLK